MAESIGNALQSPTSFLLHINTQNSRLEGKCYSLFHDQPLCFENEISLYREISHFLNQRGLLQQNSAPRYFASIKKLILTNIDRVGVKKSMQDNFFDRLETEKGTFIVQILYRQNATWQGNVKWLETGETLSFRSAMELMTIIDSAVNKNPLPTFNTKE